MSDSGPPSTRTTGSEAGQETRGALLEAGASLLRDQPAGDVLGQITGRAVAARAGRTAGAFFHHWHSQEAFHRDLLAYVLDPARIPSTAAAVQAIRTGLSAGHPPDQVLAAAARENFRGVRADPYVPLWFTLWSKHASDSQVTALLQANYQAVTQQVSAVFDALLQAAGRQVQAPFTVEALAVSATALVQGLALRVAIEPEMVPIAPSTTDEANPAGSEWDLFAHAVVTLVWGASEPRS